jgi:hypothetical protein
MMMTILAANFALAQEIIAPAFEMPTLFSVKVSAGWGPGRARQLYGYTGTQEIWWSTGEGVKMNLALDLPLIPIDVVDSLGSNSGTVPVIGLELEAATGYHLSTGGTTNDPVGGSSIQTTTRTTSYIPITLGFNARSNFGGGLPSVYIGAGGGIYLVGIYQENVTYSNDATAGFTRKMNPPLPFGLYGAIGFELPLAYDPDAANSMFDLFAEVRMTEMSAYIYSYDVISAGGSAAQVTGLQDPTLRLKDEQRSASSVAFTLGIKFNIY